MSTQGSYGQRVDPPSEYYELPAEERIELLAWIWSSLKPLKSKIHRSSSYGLKHLLEEDTGLYVTNGQFKGAMRDAGYEPVEPGERNWRFRVSTTPREARLQRKGVRPWGSEARGLL